MGTRTINAGDEMTSEEIKTVISYIGEVDLILSKKIQNLSKALKDCLEILEDYQGTNGAMEVINNAKQLLYVLEKERNELKEHIKNSNPF